METARMGSPPPLMMERRTSAAVESAVDAYATRVLTEVSPAEACVDDSLGPFVTSVLRCSLHEMEEDVSSIPEFGSLLELLEEHCSLSESSASAAITTIATAVRTGVVPERQKRGRSSSFQQGNATTESYHVDPDTLFSVAATVNEPVLVQDDFPPLSAEPQKATVSNDASVTPIKEDRLIPVDLLGALDDPSSPLAAQELKSREEAEKTCTQDDDTFPPLGATAPTTTSAQDESFPPLGTTPQTTKKHSTKGKNKSSTKKQAEDLAAVLFRSSRVRQSSIDSDNVSKSTSAGSGVHAQSSDLYHSQQNSEYFQQQWDMCVEMLLSMNPDLGEEAAVEAALIANADPNVAQYVINMALQAPPVCRHMLNDHCYRSDCQFSHDVEGHTCLFWIRGRCGKGAACRFLHGFSDKALEGVEEWQMYNASPNASSAPVAIATENLVSHNAMNAAFSAPQHEGSPFSGFQSGSHSSGFDTGSFSMPSSWAAPSSLEATMQSTNVGDQAGNQATVESSFASIASKGYSQEFSKSAASPSFSSNSPLPGKDKTVRIPQELWNPHINRDAHMFHIPDPMERYEAVSTSVTRNDVIDLHFQSLKTFSVVLMKVLPRKLREYDEVWVVTGTGHHVGNRTHQKGGGALETAVLEWLSHEGYEYAQGRDRQGHTGAILVKQTR